MLSSADEDRLMEKDALEYDIRAEYEEEIEQLRADNERYRSIINSFLDTFKMYGSVTPKNNIELRTMALLGQKL